jgi:hypothetical protein
MIAHNIPRQAIYLSSSNTFSAAFGTPTPGVFDFGVTANIGQTVQVLQPSTIYFIDTLNIGANISSLDYLASINTVPTLKFTRKIGNEIVYAKVIPVNTLAENKVATVWVKSDKGGDELLLTVTGILKMTAGLIGIGTVSLNVSCNIFAVHERDYTIWFNDQERRKI